MNDEDFEPIVIRPGEPGYEEAAKDLVNIPDNKPITLVQALRMIDSDIRGWKKRRERGEKFTLPELATEYGEARKPESLDELIENWEKEKAELEKVIAWAEKKRPGSSKKENGSLLMIEYEKSKENQN